jgi:glutathione peroxidase
MKLNALGLAVAVSLLAGGTRVMGDDPAPASAPAPAPAQPATLTATPPASDAKPDAKPEAKPADAPADEKKEDAKPAAPASPLVLGYTMKDIDGKDVDLSSFKGKVVLIVNVASNCGYTPQYTGLQKLYTDKKDKGLVILGFPANNFNEQEPGSDSEIKSFCTGKYNVTFPMFSKISVKGDDQHPLYKQLAAQPKPIGGEPGWNFTKFLVDRTGAVVGRFDSKTRPSDAKLLKQIDELLADPTTAK